ncbi:MAG: hypothetical protein SNJ82_14555 [Gemmataceae bacterium]
MGESGLVPYYAVRLENLIEVKPLPGGVFSAAYGLWTFALADHAADDTTTATVVYP